MAAPGALTPLHGIGIPRAAGGIRTHGTWDNSLFFFPFFLNLFFFFSSFLTLCLALETGTEVRARRAMPACRKKKRGMFSPCSVSVPLDGD